MKSNASSIIPPSHPLLVLVSQSTSCCSDKEISSLVLIWFIPSTETTVEKAQQLPAIIHTKFSFISIEHINKKIKYFELTAFALVFDSSDGTLLPPVDGGSYIGDVLV